MLRTVQHTAEHTYHKVNDILAAQEAILHEIHREKSIRKADLILEAIFTQPMTKVKHLVDKKYYAENTARHYLNKLAAMDILEKRTIQGHHYYINKELVRILKD